MVLPRGRLRWFGIVRTTADDGRPVEEPAALVVFDGVQDQQQFVNSGVMGLAFEGDDADTVALVLDRKPEPPSP